MRIVGLFAFLLCSSYVSYMFVSFVYINFFRFCCLFMLMLVICCFVSVSVDLWFRCCFVRSSFVHICSLLCCYFCCLSSLLLLRLFILCHLFPYVNFILWLLCFSLVYWLFRLWTLLVYLLVYFRSTLFMFLLCLCFVYCLFRQCLLFVSCV